MATASLRSTGWPGSRTAPRSAPAYDQDAVTALDNHAAQPPDIFPVPPINRIFIG